MRLLLASFLAIIGLWQQYTFSLQIRVRYADGSAASVTVLVIQHGQVVGTCATDTTGACAVNFTLDESGDDPVLQIVEHPFAPFYGPHGSGREYILTDKLATTGPLGFVLDAAEAGGVVEDLTPQSSLPVPYWHGQPVATQLVAQQTAQAFTPPTATSAPTHVKPVVPMATATMSTPTPAAPTAATLMPLDGFINSPFFLGCCLCVWLMLLGGLVMVLLNRRRDPKSRTR